MHGRRLLVLDTSHPLEYVRKNKLETSITCRNLGGYFDAVWTAHPFAPLVSSASWTTKNGRPVESTLAPGQVYIEGKLGLLDGLGPGRFNFALAQADVLARLARLIRSHGICVIRAGDPLLMGLYAWALSRVCGIPYLVRVGGNYERIRQESGEPIMPRLFPTLGMERAIEQFVLQRADLVAGANGDNLRYAIEMGTPRERGTVFRYGNLIHPAHLVAPSDRKPGRELMGELGIRGSLLLLCIGRLLPVKMPEHAVRVLAHVRSRGLDATLVMAGSGAMLEELKRLAASLNVTEHVVFAGDRDQEWLARVIPTAAAVLSPFTGRALVEVAFGAAPTVAYDIDWQGELIESGVNGELVPLRDIDGFASATMRLLTDEAYARRLGNRLRETALVMMSPEALDEHERCEYDRLFERTGHTHLPRKARSDVG